MAVSSRIIIGLVFILKDKKNVDFYVLKDDKIKSITSLIGERKLKTKKQKFFCLPHYQKMVEYAKNKLDKKKFEEFYEDVSLIQEKYFDKIIKDVSWFAKKFDYRYDSEPWYDSKDAVERAIKLLSGK